MNYQIKHLVHNLVICFMGLVTIGVIELTMRLGVAAHKARLERDELLRGLHHA